MAEDKTKKPALDLGSLATGGTQETEQLQDEQLDEVSGGSLQRDIRGIIEGGDSTEGASGNGTSGNGTSNWQTDFH